MERQKLDQLISQVKEKVNSSDTKAEKSFNIDNLTTDKPVIIITQNPINVKRRGKDVFEEEVVKKTVKKTSRKTETKGEDFQVKTQKKEDSSLLKKTSKNVEKHSEFFDRLYKNKINNPIDKIKEYKSNKAIESLISLPKHLLGLGERIQKSVQIATNISGAAFSVSLAGNGGNLSGGVGSFEGRVRRIYENNSQAIIENQNKWSLSTYRKLFSTFRYYASGGQEGSMGGRVFGQNLMVDNKGRIVTPKGKQVDKNYSTGNRFWSLDSPIARGLATSASTGLAKRISGQYKDLLFGDIGGGSRMLMTEEDIQEYYRQQMRNKLKEGTPASVNFLPFRLSRIAMSQYMRSASSGFSPGLISNRKFGDLGVTKKEYDDILSRYAFRNFETFNDPKLQTQAMKEFNKRAPEFGQILHDFSKDLRGDKLEVFKSLSTSLMDLGDTGDQLRDKLKNLREEFDAEGGHYQKIAEKLADLSPQERENFIKESLILDRKEVVDSSGKKTTVAGDYSGIDSSYAKQRRLELMDDRRMIVDQLSAGIENPSDVMTFRRIGEMHLRNPKISTNEFRALMRQEREKFVSGFFFRGNKRNLLRPEKVGTGIVGRMNSFLDNIRGGAMFQAVEEGLFEVRMQDLEKRSLREQVKQKTKEFAMRNKTLTRAVTGAIPKFKSNDGPGILSTAGSLGVKGIFGLLNVPIMGIKIAFQGITAALKGAFSFVYSALKGFAGKVVEITSSLSSNAKKILGFIFGGLLTWYTLHQFGITKKIPEMFDKLVGLTRKIMTDYVIPFISTVIGYVTEAAKAFVDEVRVFLLTNGFYEIPKKLVDFFKNFFSEQTYEGLGKTFGDFGVSILQVGGVLLDALKQLWEGISDVFVEELWPNYIEPAFISMQDSFMKLWDNILDFATEHFPKWWSESFIPWIDGIFTGDIGSVESEDVVKQRKSQITELETKLETLQVMSSPSLVNPNFSMQGAGLLNAGITATIPGLKNWGLGVAKNTDVTSENTEAKEEEIAETKKQIRTLRQANNSFYLKNFIIDPLKSAVDKIVKTFEYAAYAIGALTVLNLANQLHVFGALGGIHGFMHKGGIPSFFKRLSQPKAPGAQMQVPQPKVLGTQMYMSQAVGSAVGVATGGGEAVSMSGERILVSPVGSPAAAVRRDDRTPEQKAAYRASKPIHTIKHTARPGQAVISSYYVPVDPPKSSLSTRASKLLSGSKAFVMGAGGGLARGAAPVAAMIASGYNSYAAYDQFSRGRTSEGIASSIGAASAFMGGYGMLVSVITAAANLIASKIESAAEKEAKTFYDSEKLRSRMMKESKDEIGFLAAASKMEIEERRNELDRRLENYQKMLSTGILVDEELGELTREQVYALMENTKQLKLRNSVVQDTDDTVGARFDLFNTEYKKLRNDRAELEVYLARLKEEEVSLRYRIETGVRLTKDTLQPKLGANQEEQRRILSQLQSLDSAIDSLGDVVKPLEPLRDIERDFVAPLEALRNASSNLEEVIGGSQVPYEGTYLSVGKATEIYEEALNAVKDIDMGALKREDLDRLLAMRPELDEFFLTGGERSQREAQKTFIEEHYEVLKTLRDKNELTDDQKVLIERIERLYGNPIFDSMLELPPLLEREMIDLITALDQNTDETEKNTDALSPKEKNLFELIAEGTMKLMEMTADDFQGVLKGGQGSWSEVYGNFIPRSAFAPRPQHIQDAVSEQDDFLDYTIGYIDPYELAERVGVAIPSSDPRSSWFNNRSILDFTNPLGFMGIGESPTKNSFGQSRWDLPPHREESKSFMETAVDVDIVDPLFPRYPSELPPWKQMNDTNEYDRAVVVNNINSNNVNNTQVSSSNNSSSSSSDSQTRLVAMNPAPRVSLRRY